MWRIPFRMWPLNVAKLPHISSILHMCTVQEETKQLYQKEEMGLEGQAELVLLHNGRFCNGCITKRPLHNSAEVLYNILFHDCYMIKYESITKLMFFAIF